MSRILKWTVPVNDQPCTIGGGPVVHIASQMGVSEEVQVWTQEFDGEPRKRTVQVFGTGQPLPHFSKPLGTTIVMGGRLVWHVVELQDRR